MTTVLTTPDPDAFRTTINHKRHYVDVGLDHPAPSATSIKPEKVFRTRGPMGGWVPLDVLRAAEYVLDHREDLAEVQDPDLFLQEVCDAPKAALREASERGTEAHDAISAHILGQRPELTQASKPYFEAFLSFERDYQPEWIASEVIVVVPDLGVAGAVDAIARVGLAGSTQTAIIDWKSRGGRHGAYPEEAAQLGIYSWAEYMVVGDKPGRRVEMPDLDSLAVVSLAGDGTYALYPIDLAGARAAAQSMHNAWTSGRMLERYGKQAIGSPVVSAPVQHTLDEATAEAMLANHAETAAENRLAARTGWLRERIAVLSADARREAVARWPEGVPKKAAEITTHDQVDAIAAVLDTVEAHHGVPFGPPDPALPPSEPGSLSARAKGRRRGAA